MKGIRYTLASFTMNNRALVSAIIFGITAFFAVGLSKVDIRTIFSDLFPKDHPFVQTYQDHPQFRQPADGHDDGQGQGRHNLQPRDAAEGLGSHPRHRPRALRRPRPDSLDHHREGALRRGHALRHRHAPADGGQAPETPEEIQKFIDAVDKAPNVRTFLISEDETATIVTATFIEHSLDYGKTFEYVQQLVEEARDDNHDGLCRRPCRC
jgi:uncharacterized protein